MKYYSFDMEADSLSPTLIYVLGIAEVDSSFKNVIRSWVITDYDKMKDFLTQEEKFCIIVHNGHAFDKPEIERVLDIKINAEVIDTLGLSWYLEPKRNKHGLGSYGEDFGVPKPVIEDWVGLPIEEYIHRVEEDVKIQTKLWFQQWRHLMLLYKDTELAMKAVQYISAKMYTLAIAAKGKWKLKVKEAEKLRDMFDSKFEIAQNALEVGMPQVPVYAKKTRPKKPFKINGELSATGKKWEAITKEAGESFDFTGEIKVLTGYKDPNAGSPKQLKDWLFDMGWKPTKYDYKRNKETGQVYMIPQLKDKETGELCVDIVRLSKKTKALVYLQEMGVLKHRSGVVKGFLKAVDARGFIIAGAQGFTNTLRLRHKTALNIPSVRKPYGAEIRGLLIARNSNYELLGSDMSALEDRTKLHYMMPHDPEYVKDMSSESYDAHTDMSVIAGLMTPDEEAFFKWYKKQEH